MVRDSCFHKRCEPSGGSFVSSRVVTVPSISLGENQKRSDAHAVADFTETRIHRTPYTGCSNSDTIRAPSGTRRYTGAGRKPGASLHTLKHGGQERKPGASSYTLTRLSPSRYTR